MWSIKIYHIPLLFRSIFFNRHGLSSDPRLLIRLGIKALLSCLLIKLAPSQTLSCLLSPGCSWSVASSQLAVTAPKQPHWLHTCIQPFVPFNRVHFARLETVFHYQSSPSPACFSLGLWATQPTFHQQRGTLSPHVYIWSSWFFHHSKTHGFNEEICVIHIVINHSSLHRGVYGDSSGVK